jgi:hypothetical protein
MTLYCQHTYRLRLQQGPGKPDIVSERPRNRRTELFTDGPAGTQVEIPDDLAGFNLGAAIDINAIAQAQALLSPRAQAGLAALPASARAATAHAVATGEHTAAWDHRLSEGQPWPDVIEHRT